MRRHTVFVSIDIDNGILTAVGRGILDGKCRNDNVLATIGHRRRSRTFHIRRAHHQRVGIGRHLKRLRFHTISVTPCVMPIVDRVVIDKGAVTTSARQVTRIRALGEGDVRTAIGTLRQSRNHNLVQTMDVCRIVGNGIKITRNQIIDERPGRVVMGAVLIEEMEGHRTGAVRFHVRNTVQKDWDDLVAADILDGVRLRTTGIHQTRNGHSSVLRHIQRGGQFDVVGKLPRLGMACTIGVRIVEDQLALTAVVSRAVNGQSTGSERVAAGIRHRGQSDSRSNGIIDTVHRGILGLRQSKVELLNMPCIFPVVCRVVDRV